MTDALLGLPVSAESGTYPSLTDILVISGKIRDQLMLLELAFRSSILLIRIGPSL